MAVLSTGQLLWSCTDFSLACRRLRVAQRSFENRAGELQQSVTSEMKIPSVNARTGRTGRLIGACSGSDSRESPTRHVHRRVSNRIKCAPTHQEVKRWKENARRSVHCEDVRTMETEVVVCVFFFNWSNRRKLTRCLVVFTRVQGLALAVDPNGALNLSSVPLRHVQQIGGYLQFEM